MPLRPAVLLAALLLEDANLLALAGAVDDADDLGAVHVRRPREHVPGILADEQHLVERDGGAGLAGMAVDGNDGAGLDAELAAGGLNNGKHACTPQMGAPRNQSAGRRNLQG